MSRALTNAGADEVLVHTGQHYDSGMSQVFFDQLGLKPPRINLGVGSGSHAYQTAAMLTGLEDVLNEYHPDWVLLYGDTNSTLAGALAASKLRLRIAHVEAGLRSFNPRMPEEINRRVTDVLSGLLFAPTKAAVENLGNEGISGERVRLVGDVMFDATTHFVKRAHSESTVLERLELEENKFILVTTHRAENTDDPLALGLLADALRALNAEIPVVMPLHPRTRQTLDRLGLAHALRECRLTDPVGFLDMVQLESNAAVIVTDSGGVQKEAFFHKKPCVTLRAETEWVELVELGWNRLCPLTSTGAIIASVHAALGSRGREAQPYGDGGAAQRIVKDLQMHLGENHPAHLAERKESQASRSHRQPL